MIARPGFRSGALVTERSQSPLSVREKGLVVAAVLLPMPLAHGSLSAPLFGSGERRENTPVTLSAAPEPWRPSRRPATEAGALLDGPRRFWTR